MPTDDPFARHTYIGGAVLARADQLGCDSGQMQAWNDPLYSLLDEQRTPCRSAASQADAEET